MSLNSFIENLQNHPEINLSAQKLSQDKTKIHWAGIFGSAKSIFASGVAQQCPGHHVFVLNDKEEAAYFLNDLQGLYPEDQRLVFYPASYKVPYQIEEVDNANVVARTEALKKLSTQENCWIVTYPDALFEKVLTKKKLVSNTMKIEVGKTYSLDFINELLQEYHFERVNYVYEPGQFSIRGGIVDVFSYGNDTPFRIEFFGNEVESIRTFDAADQLSINTHKFFSIVPNIQGKMILDGMDSFFQYLNGDITIWIDSIERAKESIKKEFDKANKIYESLNQEIKKTLPSDLFINDKDFILNLENLKVIEMGTQSYFTAMKYCKLLIGNTSSGIIEAASFKKFVINLGNRQLGRAHGENVIHVPFDCKKIISKAMIYFDSIYTGMNIYELKNGSAQIIKILKDKLNGIS